MKIFRLTTEQFVEKAKIVHGDLYDYSTVIYINNKTPITVICKNHGVFKQRPSNHLSGKICKKCSSEKASEDKKSDVIDIIKNFKKIHNNEYDYSLVNYINSNVKVKIICSKHGEFSQPPSDHLKGRGCIKCGYIKRGDTNRKISKELVPLVKKIRSLVSHAYTKRDYSKKTSTYSILKCSWKEFKIHLENNPYEFKIDTVDIDLDHIIPISSAKTEKEVLELNHHTNFQLLPKYYNRWVKRTNVFDKKDFENWLKNNKV